MSAFDGQLDLLATLIASTAKFQEITGAATVAAAKDRIGKHEANDATSNRPIPYPRAILADGGVIERSRVGTSVWSGTGSLYLAFEAEAPADKTTIALQREWFLSVVSTIMRQAEVISDGRATPSGYSSTHLYIRRYRRTTGPHYEQPSERDLPDETADALRPLWVVEFEVEY